MSLKTQEDLIEKTGVVELGEAFKLNTQAEAESDLPPEYCRYHDEGCEYATACLKCPYLRCLFEEPGGRQRYLKQERDREIVRLSVTEGKAVRELAIIFGVSERTVQRVLKAARAGGLENG